MVKSVTKFCSVSAGPVYCLWACQTSLQGVLKSRIAGHINDFKVPKNWRAKWCVKLQIKLVAYTRLYASLCRSVRRSKIYFNCECCFGKTALLPCPTVRDCHAVCLALFQLLPAFNMPESDVPWLNCFFRLASSLKTNPSNWDPSFLSIPLSFSLTRLQGFPFRWNKFPSF